MGNTKSNKGETIFYVTTFNGTVNEYFKSRQSAINFIVDEFEMALMFRNDKEGEKLKEYLIGNDETPDVYPYKYIIKTIHINTEYDD